MKRLFPDHSKIAKVTPIYRNSDSSEISNYKEVLVLPRFSRILERLTYNHLQKYLKVKNILCEKHFGFQSTYSTNYAIIELVDKTFDSFEEKHLTLGIFIELSTAFDAVHHSILLKKLTDKNLIWFDSYRSNRTQFIRIGENSKIDLKHITCGVPQASIPGPILFLVYTNDLGNASHLLDLVIFVDDTNHKDL